MLVAAVVVWLAARPAEPLAKSAELVPAATPQPVDLPVKPLSDEPAAPTPVAPAASVAPEPSPAVVAEVAAQEPRATRHRDRAEAHTAEPAPVDPLAGVGPLALVGPEAGGQAAEAADAALLAKVARHGAWQAYQRLLGTSIDAALKQVAGGDGARRWAAVWDEPALRRGLLRWMLIERIGPEVLAGCTRSHSSAPELLAFLCTTPEVLEELLATLAPQDNATGVLDVLAEAWAAGEETFAKYHSLAIACAVVFDQPVDIPNPLGKDGTSGGAARVKPLERYQWYIAHNEKARLATPIHRTPARDLVWVVCAPVATSELDWAVDKLRLSRRAWGSTYGMVRYLMERAVSGLNPYKEYSFAEILKEGGICADQSYFCVNTARAMGIPAMTLGGETDAGGHAWAALKLDPDTWDTTIGRIGGVSKGMAENPQTRTAITEQELIHWNERQYRSQSATTSVARYLWLAEYLAATKRQAEQAELVRFVNRTAPGFPETWQALHAVLVRETTMAGDPPVPTNLEEWKDFCKGMRREFKDNPRLAQLAAEAEMQFVFPYTDPGAVERALQVERRRIERDSPEQMDLVASSLKRQADVIQQRGGAQALTEISQLYDRGLRDYGGSITGFKMMAEDYFGRMRDNPELARKAARDVELAFKRVVETGTTDWFRASTETEIYKMICGYYRSAGEPERAELLEKRYESLMKRAKRAAE